MTPEQFANVKLREEWRREKNMIVLQLWSDEHRRTPIDVFVYEPFNFDKELAQAAQYPIEEQMAPVVSRKTLIKLKRAAGRSQDLADIEKLEKLAKLRKKR